MESLNRLQQLIPGLTMDVLRLITWLVILIIIFGSLEKLFARHKQNLLRKSFFNDLGYYFINSLLPTRVLVIPMTAMAWVLHPIVPPQLQQWVGELPLWQKILGSVFVGELGFYWGHRLMHEIPFLWRFHAVHHSAEEMDWLVNTRAHPVDIIFIRLCGFVPMFLLGFTQVSSNTADIGPLLIILIGTMWGFFIHSNLNWRLGWLSWLISTPEFHHWHHTNDDVHVINKNYASMLPIYDLLFGTFYLPKHWPNRYGIDAPMARGLAGQIFQPFWFRKSR